MWKKYILFRSRKLHTHTSWQGDTLHTWWWIDISDFSPYNPWDNIRDISWKHSAKNNGLIRKVREENDTFPLGIIDFIHENYEFYTIKDPISVGRYRNDLSENIRSSAKKYNFPIININTTKKYANILSSMIFIFIHDIDWQKLGDIRWLSAYNDVILVHIIHPYEVELANEEDIIISGYNINKKSYLQLHHEENKRLKEFASHNKISYLNITTRQDICDTLSQFFKHRII